MTTLELLTTLKERVEKMEVPVRYGREWVNGYGNAKNDMLTILDELLTSLLK